MKKKFIIILAIMALFSFVISGCLRTENNEETNDKEPKETIYEENDVIEISFGLIGISELTDDVNSVSPVIDKLIREKFGIAIKPITFNEGEWKEQLDWMISVNQVPDVFYHDLLDDKIQYRQLLDLGQIRDVPKSMWAIRDNLSRVMSWYEGTYAIEDKMYFIPRTYQTYDQTHGSSYAVLYRKDWSSKMIASPPSEPTFLDLTEMVKAYVSNDPNDNNVKDTWGITGANGVEFIKHTFLEPFGVRDWVYEDSKWVPGILSEKAKVAVAWASQMYKEGLIDPNFITQSEEEALNRFLTGKVGACVTSIYPEQIKQIEEKWILFNSSPAENSIGVLPLCSSTDGKHYNELDTFNTGTLFSSQLTDKQLERVLDLFDWLYTEEARTYLEYGEFNIDYLLEAQLPKTLLKDENMEPITFSEKNIEFAPIKNLVSWNLDFSSYHMKNMTIFQQSTFNVLQKDIWPWSYENMLFTEGMLTPEICIMNIEDVAGDKLLDVIMTSTDFEASWNEYVDYCYETFNVEEAAKEVAQNKN